MSVTDELIKRARFLRNAAPREYRDFYAAFADYAEVSAEIMIETTGNLALYQGHAQQCRKLMQVLDAGAKDG